MTLLNVFLLLGCITFAACDGVDIDGPTDCKWTGCEGAMRSGTEICKEYGYSLYTERLSLRGCNWDASKVYCCTETCQWSECYSGNFIYSNVVCETQFGKKFTFKAGRICPSNNRKYQFKCCPPGVDVYS